MVAFLVAITRKIKGMAKEAFVNAQRAKKDEFYTQIGDIERECSKYKAQFKDKIIFQYAGNMGRVQGLLDLLKIIGQINNDQLAFYFVGEGAVKEEMINYVNSFKISNVYFGNAYSRDEQISVLNQADCAFVSLAQGMYGLGVPSKTYNILAAGKPILYIGEENSEINLLVKENNIIYSFICWVFYFKNIKLCFFSGIYIY